MTNSINKVKIPYTHNTIFLPLIISNCIFQTKSKTKINIMNYRIAENINTYVFKSESGLRLYIKIIKLNIGFMVLNNLL